MRRRSIKSDSSSETDFMHNNTKWRKRPKNIALTADSATKDIIYKPLFVNFLLASKESLIIQCLWKKDYAKAQDIIEVILIAQKTYLYIPYCCFKLFVRIFFKFGRLISYSFF